MSTVLRTIKKREKREMVCAFSTVDGTLRGRWRWDLLSWWLSCMHHRKGILVKKRWPSSNGSYRVLPIRFGWWRCIFCRMRVNMTGTLQPLYHSTHRSNSMAHSARTIRTPRSRHSNAGEHQLGAADARNVSTRESEQALLYACSLTHRLLQPFVSVARHMLPPVRMTQE